MKYCYDVDVISSSDYYPFGSLMPGRSFTPSEGYRYGFNGMEKDDEVSGVTGSHLDFGARMYDPRIGKWFSPDAYEKKYTPISPYVFSLNNPIKFVDADGNVVTDENGNPVTITVTEGKDGAYNAGFEFSTGTSQDVIDKFNDNAGRIIKSMIQVESGRDGVQKAVASSDKIHYNYDSSKKGSGSKSGFKLGTTSIKNHLVKNAEGTPIGIDPRIEITIYEKDIINSSKMSFEGLENIPEEENLFRDNNLSTEQKVGSVATHETFHATNKNDVEALKTGKAIPTGSEEHKPAKEEGQKATKEFGEKNKKK